MTSLLLLSLLLAGDIAATLVGDIREGDMKTVERSYEMTEPIARYFVVSFAYDPHGAYAIPATYPPGPPHYGALVTVFEIKDGKKVQLGEPFLGQFTEEGCFEDKPETLVKRALGWRWDGQKYVLP